MRRAFVVLGFALLTAVLAAPQAHADWPPFGRLVCGQDANQVHASIASDGADGAIITWQDFRSLKVNVFAQHVLASGERDVAWPVDGRALLTDAAAMEAADGGQTSPVIVPDGAGGAIVAWQDNRDANSQTDIFAQHVLGSGVVDPAWPANGTALCAADGLQKVLTIAADGAGGAFVTWMDSRPGVSVLDIYAQHVLASGLVDARWPVNGLAVCTAAGLQEFPIVIEDGAGGAIITWDDARGTNVDVYAQHVLASGVVDPAWPVNGRAVCAAAGDQGGPSIVSDGAHGAIVAWSDSRIVGTSHIFAQHVLAGGAVDPLWPTDGRAISAAAFSESRSLVVSDGLGGAVVAWQGFTVHLNMYAQHVLATGIVDPAWPAGGRALSDVDRTQSHAEAVADGAGGAIVAWQDSFDVVAQHVQANGSLDPAYPDSFRTISNLPTQEGDVTLVATSGGGAIAAWTDTRSLSSTDIFALQILDAGTVDVPRPEARDIAFAAASPNPARGPLTLRFTLARAGAVDLAVYDAVGRRVRRLASDTRDAGTYTIDWDLRDESGRGLGAGVYIARLESGGSVLTRKITKAN